MSVAEIALGGLSGPVTWVGVSSAFLCASFLSVSIRTRLPRLSHPDSTELVGFPKLLFSFSPHGILILLPLHLSIAGD